ncbi:MAG TPA: hypothetical protein VGM93_08085 [Acidimicrobiales bacterium]|jgi:hypothetical protein
MMRKKLLILASVVAIAVAAGGTALAIAGPSGNDSIGLKARTVFASSDTIGPSWSISVRAGVSPDQTCIMLMEGTAGDGHGICRSSWSSDAFARPKVNTAPVPSGDLLDKPDPGTGMLRTMVIAPAGRPLAALVTGSDRAVDATTLARYQSTPVTVDGVALAVTTFEFKGALSDDPKAPTPVDVEYAR